MTTTIFETKNIIENRKAFLFDFDGTLVNLDNLNVDSFKIVIAEEYDLPFSRDDFMKYMSGRGSKDGFKMFLDAKSISEYDVNYLSKKFSRIKSDLIRNHLKEEVFPIPGIEVFLEHLKQTKKRMIVVTSSRHDYVKNILSFFNLFDYFEKIYDRGSVEKSKPNPEIFLKGIQYTGLDVSECIAFEDSLFGLQSAKSANLFTVGILNKGWNDDFVYDHADIVVESYEELI